MHNQIFHPSVKLIKTLLGVVELAISFPLPSPPPPPQKKETFYHNLKSIQVVNNERFQIYIFVLISYFVGYSVWTSCTQPKWWYHSSEKFHK